MYRQARRLYHRTAGVDGEQGAAAERAAEADEAAADTPTFKVVSAEEHTRRVDKRKQATAAYDQLKLVRPTLACPPRRSRTSRCGGHTRPLGWLSVSESRESGATADELLWTLGLPLSAPREGICLRASSQTDVLMGWARRWWHQRVDSTMRCVDEGICLRAYQSAVGFPCQVPKLPRHPKWASHERPLAGDRTPPQPPTWGPLQVRTPISHLPRESERAREWRSHSSNLTVGVGLSQMARMISGSGFREVNVAFELGDQPFDPAAFLRGLVVARL